MRENYEIKRTQTLVTIGIVTGLIATVTLIIKIPSATGGYLNLSDFVIMVSPIMLPLGGAIFAAGVGCALADIAGGYAVYAIFSLFIKAGEVIIIKLLERYLDTRQRWIPFSLAALWMMTMYGFVAVFLTKSWPSFFVALKGDLFQGVFAVILATIFYPRLQKLMKYLRGN
ncbi:ECF transporter S component [Erysipelothrix enhydrae]|uniref:ECF transporter S component n=1 Tax=Erysipelothrix enhydrae TaxID=2890314 RepID=UPI002B24CB0C|nr:ECF transporter S component [Erysipelothrix sp. 4322-04]WRB86485.1 ECF transporter S component [Erysipelothrix sp. 4322-04]